ncbi:universal stress protein [Spongiimicrobium salis]|uniref:universal stress protein n=1 Tax=Spongiimicrobium salis TaxID=1667022 RepID=UPI00374CDB4A
MKHILIPTDFSDNAWNAMVYGLRLFKEVPCTFYVMYISTISTYSGEETILMGSRDVMLQASTKRLQDLIAVLTAQYFNPKHTFVPVAAHDFFVEAIQKKQQKHHISLIIMGTKGATGLKKATIGSNTANVITKVKCPILVVPEKASFTGLVSIAFPTDYILNYETEVLDTLMELIELHGSSLQIMHMSKEPSALSPAAKRNKEFLHQHFTEIPHEFREIHGNRLEVVLHSFCEKQHTSMIAMVAKNLNFLQRLLFRPTVEKISYHTKIPFLVLHE